jgi:hypothetical protein
MSYIIFIIISLVTILITIYKYNVWDSINKETFRNKTKYNIYNGVYNNYLPKHIINKIKSQYQLNPNINNYNKSVSQYYLI